MATSGLGTVVIGGGTGFVGSALAAAFESIGSKVWIISRLPNSSGMSWEDLAAEGLPKDTSVVINVAGQNVLDAKKSWSEGFKQNVMSSRINTTRSLASAIQRSEKPPKAFVTISGVGYYPPSETKEYNEFSSGGKGDFFAELCQQWEEAGTLPNSLPTRHVVIRSGVVLGRYGGMIKQLYFPFFMGVGGRMGSGKQWMPWIHVDDLVRMFLFASQNEEVTGVLNGVAPNPATNAEFTNAFAAAMWRPALFPVPEAILRFAFSAERARMVVEGQKVLPKRTLDLGFTYQHPEINEACKAALQ
ncbi:Epimerase family protein SDR39U1 [Halotydeus destructor]|nr:Epimerase family protein SDR39U1 [Halotydeus destructor]